MAKKIPSKSESKNVGSSVLEIMRSSTKRKENMYKKVTGDIAEIKKTQEENTTQIKNINNKLMEIDNKFKKNTKEIIEVIHEVVGNQTEILFAIQEDLRGIKKDLRIHDIRLNDHDVRLEKLEKAAN